MIKKYSIFIVVVAAGFLISSCEDKDKIAQGQACLDAVPQSSYSQALACANYVDGDSSQQAEIIRCAAYMMGGGLTTNKMVNAYKALSGKTAAGASVTNKEAVFISTLVLDSTAAAEKADTSCKKTNVTGLIYISGLAVVGTRLSEVADAIAGSFSDPPTEAQVNAVINNCTGGTPNAACSPSVIGGVASTVASTYCASSSADQSVCADVNNAIASGGGDSSKIGNALMCLLKNGTYNATTDTCT